jgi:putative flippase GtrA
MKPGVGSVQTGVWLPNTQVNNHVRIGVVNNGANAVTIAGFHQVKRTSLQTPARRIGINTNYFANGRIFFKQRPNKRAKFSTQAGDNNSASTHGPYLTPTA